MNKNKIKQISMTIIFLIVSITYTIANKTDKNIGSAVQVTSLPVSGRVVILDAGHGTPDERC